MRGQFRIDWTTVRPKMKSDREHPVSFMTGPSTLIIPALSNATQKLTRCSYCILLIKRGACLWSEMQDNSHNSHFQTSLLQKYETKDCKRKFTKQGLTVLGPGSSCHNRSTAPPRQSKTFHRPLLDTTDINNRPNPKKSSMTVIDIRMNECSFQ